MDLDSDSKTEVELKNGSRIVSLPAGEAKIRGFSAVNLLIVDESGDVDDELYKAVVPMLIVSRGRLLAMGTPKGRRGWFFEAWDRGGDGWLRVSAPWQKIPRFSAEEIAIQRAALGEKFPQEFECQFLRLAGGMVYSAFSPLNVVDSLPDWDRREDRAKWSWLLGVDFGFVDSTAFVVMGWRPNDPVLYVVRSFKQPGLHAAEIADKIRELRQEYPFTRIIGDVSGYGKGPAEEMRSRFRINVEPAPKTEKAGHIDQLNGAFAMGLVRILRRENAELVQEIEALPWNEARTNHADGFEDHLCDGLLYGWRVSSTYLQTALPPPLTPNEQISADVARHWELVERRRSKDWWVQDGSDEGEIVDPFDQ